jgi:hypothetical protein
VHRDGVNLLRPHPRPREGLPGGPDRTRGLPIRGGGVHRVGREPHARQRDARFARFEHERGRSLADQQPVAVGRERTGQGRRQRSQTREPRVHEQRQRVHAGHHDPLAQAVAQPALGEREHRRARHTRDRQRDHGAVQTELAGDPLSRAVTAGAGRIGGFAGQHRAVPALPRTADVPGRRADDQRGSLTSSARFGHRVAHHPAEQGLGRSVAVEAGHHPTAGVREALGRVGGLVGEGMSAGLQQGQQRVQVAGGGPGGHPGHREAHRSPTVTADSPRARS